jgi:integrase
LKGFGVRVMPPSSRNPTGTKTWIVEYRPGCRGRQTPKRRFTIGSYDTISPEAARQAAQKILSRVLVDGEDPASERKFARETKTIGALKDAYFESTNPYRKPRTRELYKALWRLHIDPEIGSVRLDLVSRAHVERLHRKVGERHPTTANRVKILVSHFFAWAGSNNLCDPAHNPARGIKKFREESRERHLSPDEFRRLGAAISKAESVGIRWTADPTKKVKHAPKQVQNQVVKINLHAAAAIRLLVLTGARLREILHLEWHHVDTQRGYLDLPDSKTGKKRIVLPAPAIDILERLRAVRSTTAGAAFVIEGADPTKPRADLQRPWNLIRKEARLTDVRLHDLRHAFASVGAASNLGLPVLGALLGHSDAETTRRYAHLADAPLRAAADHIATQITGMMSHG